MAKRIMEAFEKDNPKAAGEIWCPNPAGRVCRTFTALEALD
jgi:hypothetical protein